MEKLNNLKSDYWPHDLYDSIATMIHDSLTGIHKHVQMHAHAHTRTHAHTHTHPPTHARTHACTHTHTHTHNACTSVHMKVISRNQAHHGCTCLI